VPKDDLKDASSHFAFGENWASYAALIDDAAIAESKKGLLKLIPREAFPGRSFMDIGCGSGLHALAATELGVGRILAVDIDPVSVETTKAVLTKRNVEIPWQAENVSVFDLDVARLGTFDIVYSWGVLHHTGDMWEAVRKAAFMVAPNGLFAFALYRSTTMDPFWKIEKRWYTNASPFAQKMAQKAYVGGYAVARRLTGRGGFRDLVDNYRSARGMDFYHDVHDWLGGYPYEAALAPEIDERMKAMGFGAERVFARSKPLGLFGSGCDEYVYRRRPV
jgi:SAM-dependent methyltransferase